MLCMSQAQGQVPFEQDAQECEPVRYPAPTQYLRPVVTSQLLGVVQRQMMNLFYRTETCANLEVHTSWSSCDEQFTKKFVGEPSHCGAPDHGLGLDHTELDVVVQILCCLTRWDGGSLKGVPADLRPGYRQAVKRQIAKLFDTASCTHGSSQCHGDPAGELGCLGTEAEVEVAKPAATKLPAGSKLVEACMKPVRITTTLPEEAGKGRVPRSVSVCNCLIRPAGRIRPAEISQTSTELDNQRHTSQIARRPATVRWETEVNLKDTPIRMSGRYALMESGTILPEEFCKPRPDIVQRTGPSGREQGSFRAQPIMVDIVRQFALRKLAKASVPQCENESSLCSFGNCFRLRKPRDSKPLRGLFRRLLCRLRHRRPINLAPLHQVQDRVISEQTCCERGLSAGSAQTCAARR